MILLPFQMIKRIVLALIFGFVVSRAEAAQGSAADLNPRGSNASAVDAQGVRHYGSDYKGRSSPWLIDQATTVAPDYPVAERRLRHQGRALVRLDLDLKTGRVINATVLKSTGFAALDNSAVAAFSRWTWQPGRWKEIVIGVNFQMKALSSHPRPGSVRLPKSPVS